MDRGRVILYDNNGSSGVRVGRDMDDLAGKVVKITSRQSGADAPRRMVVVSDPRRIARIVTTIEASPAGDPEEYYEHYVVAFHLRDGTRTFAGFQPRAGSLDQLLLLPPDVVRALTPR